MTDDVVSDGYPTYQALNQYSSPTMPASLENIEHENITQLSSSDFGVKENDSYFKTKEKLSILPYI